MVRRAAGLAVLVASLAAAAPAAASTADSAFHDDGGCGFVTNTFTAGAGERNIVTVAAAKMGIGDPFGLGFCTDMGAEAFALTDPGATIRPQGLCRFAIGFTNRAVLCPAARLSVSLGDKNDVLTTDWPTTVSCGPGNDVVIGLVTAASDCETVLPG